MFVFKFRIYVFKYKNLFQFLIQIINFLYKCVSKGYYFKNKYEKHNL